MDRSIMSISSIFTKVGLSIIDFYKIRKNQFCRDYYSPRRIEIAFMTFKNDYVRKGKTGFGAFDWSIIIVGQW